MIDENKLRTLIINAGGCDAKDDYSRDWDDAIGEVLDILDNQLKVGEWIPVSERLPELHRVNMESEGEYYMISDSVIITDGERISISGYEVDDGDRGGWLACECKKSKMLSHGSHFRNHTRRNYNDRHKR